MGGPQYSRACHRALAGCEWRERLMRGGERLNPCKNIRRRIAAAPRVETDMNHQLIAGGEPRAIRLATHLVPAAQFLAHAGERVEVQTRITQGVGKKLRCWHEMRRKADGTRR